MSSTRCQADCKDEHQCSRNAEIGFKYCWQHKNYENSAYYEVKKLDVQKKKEEIVKRNKYYLDLMDENDLYKELSEELDEYFSPESEDNYLNDLPTDILQYVLNDQLDYDDLPTIEKLLGNFKFKRNKHIKIEIKDGAEYTYIDDNLAYIKTYYDDGKLNTEEQYNRINKMRRIKRSFYPDGKIKKFNIGNIYVDFYENGNIKHIRKKERSIIEEDFYENGNIKSRIIQSKDQFDGSYTIIQYDQNGNIIYEREEDEMCNTIYEYRNDDYKI